MKSAFNVLFLCTHNSARSLMAEAIAAKHAGTDFNVYSAGTAPYVHPDAEVISKLQTLGYDTSNLTPKFWTQFTDHNSPKMDFVISLDEQLDDAPRKYFADSVNATWPLPDTSDLHGNPAERAALLNEIYARLQRVIGTFMALPLRSLDEMVVKAKMDAMAVEG